MNRILRLLGALGRRLRSPCRVNPFAVCAVLLGESIAGQSNSRYLFWVGYALRDALISFVPMSILIFGGNQGIPDRIVGITVQRQWETTNSRPPSAGLKTWVLLCFSSVVWGILLATLAYLAVGRVLLSGSAEKPPAKYIQQVLPITDPESVRSLWAVLPLGLKEREPSVKDIEISEMSPNPFTFQSERLAFH